MNRLQKKADCLWNIVSDPVIDSLINKNAKEIPANYCMILFKKKKKHIVEIVCEESNFKFFKSF